MAEKTLTFFEKVSAIQCNLHAPKNLYNSFGKYSYRNAEGICEAVKPLLKQYGLILTIQDKIHETGNRVYVEATATITDGDSVLTNTAYAREAESKSGMDAAQITGAASSYARKYALNGLFLLDDTKDPDTEEYKIQAENAQKKVQAQAKPAAQPAKQPAPPTKKYTDADKNLAIEASSDAESRDELKMIMESYPGLNDQYPEFGKAVNKRWSELKK